MSRARHIIEGPGALELIEDSFHCLRRAPAAAWVIYFAGTLPFILGFLYFWADMSRGSLAGERLVGSALAMAGLFVWMKTCQSRFAAHLTARLAGWPPPAWGPKEWLGVMLRQAVWQPFGLFVLPLALVLLAPFGWVYAFFQNLTALDDPTRSASSGLLARRAWAQAILWPGQNHAALFAYKGFAWFVFLNLIVASLAIPYLMRMFLGIETAFSRAMGEPMTLVLTIFNTTFLSAMAGLAYVCVDPFLKAFYVLRCFHGESLRTGQDIQAELNHWRSGSLAATAAVLLLVMAPLLASAAERPASSAAAVRAVQLDSTELDRAIDDVLSGREYRWRLPRVGSGGEREKGFLVLLAEEIMEMLKSGLETVLEWGKKLLNWLFGRRLGGGIGGGMGWQLALRGVLLLLVGVLVFLVVLLLVRAWRHRPRLGEVQAAAVPQPPDIEDEHIAADQLPEDRWLELAGELAGRGEFRLALRALYLASLAHLAGRQFLTIAKFKSNFDYLRELQRRGHVLPELLRPFGENVAVFDRVWYGSHNADAALFDLFSNNVDQIRRQG